MNKPVLYNNNIIPFDILDDKRFADFIYDIIPHIFDDFNTIGSPPESWDGGFDVRAKHNAKEYFICIQCKKYKSKLTLEQISTELAKVALTSKDEGFETKEHYFFTIEGTNKAGYFLENKDRKKLKDNAISALKDPKNFKTTKKSLESKNIDLENTVNQYIDNLKIIDVYDKTRIDGKIAKQWDIFLSNIAEHYFTIQSVVREYPRPNFDFEAYKKKILNNYNNKYEEYFVEYQESIRNLKSNKEYNEQNNNKSFDKVFVKNLSYYLPRNNISFLIGIGGLGKSTSCEIIRYNYTKAQNDESKNLPILIKASHYKFQQDINKLINNELRIDFGIWHSMPYNFLLIIDGLNEISDELKEKLINELELEFLSRNINIIILISTREGKFLSEIEIQKIGIISKLNNLTFIDIRKLCRKNLNQNETENFLIQYDKKYKDYETIKTPFFIIKAIKKYKQTKTLPENFGDLVSYYFKKRYNENIGQISATLRPIIDYKLIFDLMSRIAFHFRVEKNSNSFQVRQLTQFIKQLVKENKFNILDQQNRHELLKLLVDFEILITENMIYEIEHDILADYFASSILAEDWESHLYLLEKDENNLLWIFTASFLEQDQIDKFLKVVAEKDILLACRCYNNIYGIKENVLDRIIMSKYEINRQYYDWLSTEAMTILNNQKYKLFLHKEYIKLKEDSERKPFLKRALAIMGDEQICEEVLDGAEEENAIPFTNISNGDKDLWRNLPLDIRLNYTRKRTQGIINKLNNGEKINRYKESCDLSLKNLITLGGSEADILFAKQIFENSNEYITCYFAYFLILINNYEDNEQYLKEKIKKFGFVERYSAATEALKYGRTLFNANENIFAINALFDIFTIQEAFKNKKDLDWDDIKKIDLLNPEITTFLQKNRKIKKVPNFLRSMEESISKYLKSIFLCKKCFEKVFELLSKYDILKIKNIFWDLCLINDIAEARELATNLLENEDLKIIAKSLNYLNNNNMIDNYIQEKVIKIVNKNSTLWMSYEYYEILNTITQNFENEEITELINSKLQYLLIDRQTVTDYNIEITIIRYLILASNNSKLVKKSIIFSSFNFYKAGYHKDFENIYLKLLSALSEEEIDSHITKEIIYNKNFLIALSEFKKTPKRIEIILSIINKAATLQIYKKVIQKYWCDELAEFIIKKFVAEERKDEFYSFENYHNLFTKDQISKYINFNIETITNETKKRIIQLWCDSAKNR